MIRRNSKEGAQFEARILMRRHNRLMVELHDFREIHERGKSHESDLFVTITNLDTGEKTVRSAATWAEISMYIMAVSDSLPVLGIKPQTVWTPTVIEKVAEA